MADIDATRKTQIYHTLSLLNDSFSAIVTHCRSLEETQIFRSKFMTIFQGLTLELQAEINQELLETLHNIELEDWSRYGRVRIDRENELREPSGGEFS